MTTNEQNSYMREFHRIQEYFDTTKYLELDQTNIDNIIEYYIDKVNKESKSVSYLYKPNLIYR